MKRKLVQLYLIIVGIVVFGSLAYLLGSLIWDAAHGDANATHGLYIIGALVMLVVGPIKAIGWLDRDDRRR